MIQVPFALRFAFLILGKSSVNVLTLAHSTWAGPQFGFVSLPSNPSARLCSIIHGSSCRWIGPPQMQHGARLFAVQFSEKMCWRRAGDIWPRGVGEIIAFY